MKTFATILQSMCIAFVFTGIITEIRLHADFGFLFITAGSFAFAVSTKLNKIALRRELTEYKHKLEDKNHESTLGAG